MSVLLAASGLLTACGTSGQKADKRIVVFNYGDYIDHDVLKEFEKETGISVAYEEFLTPEAMYTKYKNGTIHYDLICCSDYMLDKMNTEGADFNTVLKEAQEKGYAEADPTADVEGYDAGRKIAIMASIAFSSRVTFPQVYTEGITKITAEDIRYAKEFGYVIKLLGITKLTGKGIEVKVHPTLIPDSHPLATVRDSFNAVFVHGQACDDAMFMGRGAGQMPTASAVLGDVIDVMRNIIHGSCGKIGSDSHKKLPVLDVEETKSRFFLRLQVENRAGALANIAGVLGNNDVSIAQMVQKRSHDGIAEIVVITDLVTERHFNDAIRIMEGMSVVREISGIIRVY